MSFKNRLISNLTSIIDEFISAVALKYNIPESDLRLVWDAELYNYDSFEAFVNDENFKNFNTLKRDDLILICKSHSIQYYGTKVDIIKRLIAAGVQSPVGSIEDNVVSIKKNKYNHYILSESNPLIFDATSKQVIGREAADGTVQVLSEADVEFCRDNGFIVCPQILSTSLPNASNDIKFEIDSNDDDESDE